MIFFNETRLRRPTLINQLQNQDANPRTPVVQYVEIFAGVGSMSSTTETHGGEIAMFTEKEPVASENLRHRFPDATIYDDIDDDSKWGKFKRKPGTALRLLAGPPCQPFAPTRKGGLDDDPLARFLLESVVDTVKKLRPDIVDIETVCSAADAKGGAILQQPNDSITKHGYSRIAPNGGTSPERISTSHLGSAVDRTRLAVH